MTYRLFLDDERNPPEDGRVWVVARSSAQAIETVKLKGLPQFISFDHDLGSDDTAMPFVRWLQDVLLDFQEPREFDYYVHSQNPVGRDNIIGAWQSFDRYTIGIDGQSDLL